MALILSFLPSSHLPVLVGILSSVEDAVNHVTLNLLGVDQTLVRYEGKDPKWDSNTSNLKNSTLVWTKLDLPDGIHVWNQEECIETSVTGGLLSFYSTLTTRELEPRRSYKIVPIPTGMTSPVSVPPKVPIPEPISQAITIIPPSVPSTAVPIPSASMKPEPTLSAGKICEWGDQDVGRIVDVFCPFQKSWVPGRILVMMACSDLVRVQISSHETDNIWCSLSAIRPTKAAVDPIPIPSHRAIYAPAKFNMVRAVTVESKWSDLKVGQEVDVKCVHTQAWFRAVILELAPDDQTAKIHFIDWPERFDAWYSLASILPLHTYTTRLDKYREGYKTI